MNNIEIDPNKIVLLLNKLLASEPELVLNLLKNRPTIEQEISKDLLSIQGNKISIIGLINAILKDHNSDILIGADCEFEDGEMSYVKFFHLLERK